jgi:cytochrome oxidase Cu insertion factor (SCO1/SenC/PrrC family)
MRTELANSLPASHHKPRRPGRACRRLQCWFTLGNVLLGLSLTACSSSRVSSTPCSGTAVDAQNHTAASPVLPANPVTESSEETLFSTPFLPPGERAARLHLDYPVTTHDGTRTNLQSLVDRPTAISFAYSRCANPNKCPRVVSTMGLLQTELGQSNLAQRVRLLLITFDPAYDTPTVMRAFARLNGLHLDQNTVFLRPEPDHEHRLFRDLGARASFNDDAVALHGIQLLLLDKQGRLARFYHTLLWDNQQAVFDLQRLAAE